MYLCLCTVSSLSENIALKFIWEIDLMNAEFVVNRM